MAKISMNYKTGAFRPNIRKCSLWTVAAQCAHSKYTLNAGNTNVRVVHHIRFIVIPYFLLLQR
jgi:hypothetical protein